MTVARMERCQHILAAVSNLSPTETDELFKILVSTKCEYSRNDNGIFINLRWVDEGVLHKIEQFMAFCTKNRIELEKYERLRRILTENFAAAANTLVPPSVVPARAMGIQRAVASAANGDGDGDGDGDDAGEEIVVGPSKVAPLQVPAIIGGMTTLKFNLLKKKFAKPYNASSRFEQGDLVKEIPIISR